MGEALGRLAYLDEEKRGNQISNVLLVHSLGSTLEADEVKSIFTFSHITPTQMESFSLGGKPYSCL